MIAATAPATKPKPLTERQREMYDFMRAQVASRGMSPTIREIGAAMGIRSPNGVMAILRPLVAKGYVRQVGAGLARSLVPVDVAGPNPPGPPPVEVRASPLGDSWWVATISVPGWKVRATRETIQDACRAVVAEAKRAGQGMPGAWDRYRFIVEIGERA